MLSHRGGVADVEQRIVRAYGAKTSGSVDMKKAVVFLGLFVLAIGAGWILFRSSPMTTAIDVVQQPIAAVRQVFIPDPVDLFHKDRLRVLLIGLDYDYDRLDQETSKSSRSDIIMALNLDFKNHRISELSVPRDMVATMPNGQQAKINQAQSEGGIAESQSVIANWLGVPPFDRYIVMRIDTTKDLINAIGGIDVNVENSDALRGTGKNGPIDYVDTWGHLYVHLKPGLQHLDGAQAVGYARFRHDWCSDPCRIMRQQQVIRAFVNRLERDKLNTIEHAQQLLAVAHKDIETNFTIREEIASAMAFAHVTQRDIRTAQVPYVASVMLPGYGDSIIPDEAAKQRLVATLLADPHEDVAGTAPTPDVSLAGIRVRVENGTTVPGLAARVAATLQRRGFTIAGIADAPSRDFLITQIQSAPSRATASDSVRKALEPNAATTHFALVAMPPEAGSDVTIVLGRDIVDARP
jgi:LCP family protein required for cell wall assembly